jgi:phospholipid-binding lipoprotein MlaA
MSQKSKQTTIKILFLSFFFINFNNLYAEILDKNKNDVNDYYVAEIWDPFESVNRKIFNFNLLILNNIGSPFYNVYNKVTNKEIKGIIGNILNNFKMPVFLLNYVIQLDLENSLKSIYSFAINSIFGGLGMFDIASFQNVRPPDTNLGITLAKYGVPAGPYLMLPILGVTDVRGFGGRITETLVDPFSYNIIAIGGKSNLLGNSILISRNSLYGIDMLAFIMEDFYNLLEFSFDPYVLVRNAYKQNQNYKINKIKSN